MPLQQTIDEGSGRLQQLLSAELESTGKLLELLEQEHQLLVNGEAEEIRAISAQKQAQTMLLREQLLVRDRFLAAHRLPSGKEGTDLFIGQTDSDSAIRQCWSKVQALATQLNYRNEVNGGIVALAQRHVREALNILTCHTDQESTYGPAGQRMGRSPQSLAKV
ncbi:MAG: flagellar protein FlgN [Gammaproteobacteria bacterium]|nr:flagellar protein FlgN [Gammaproteobacteria bacterium]